MVDDDALGSIEYAVEHLNTPLIVVMGHQSCGAVTAAYNKLIKGEALEGHIEDIVEKIGVERSREKIQEADLVLLVLDSSRELDDEDKEIIDSVGDKKCVVILNKIDLESKIDENIISNFDNIIKISAKEEIGLGDLKNTIKDLFCSGKIDTESLIISNSRHKQALFRALENAEMALSKVRMNEYLDLISIFVTSSLRALNEITGDELEEDLVNKIFGDFCVGK